MKQIKIDHDKITIKPKAAQEFDADAYNQDEHLEEVKQPSKKLKELARRELEKAAFFQRTKGKTKPTKEESVQKIQYYMLQTELRAQ